MCGLPPSFQHGYKYGRVFTDVHTVAISAYGQVRRDGPTSAAVTKRYEADMAAYGSVVRYHSDGGKELIGSDMQSFLATKPRPTTITWIVAENSNFNPLAENTIWVVFCVLRALLIDCGLPFEHWAVAMLYAAYLLLRTPRFYSRSSEYSTPYAMLHRGKKPSLKHVRIFGALAHALLAKSELRKSKLDSRTVVGFFVGFSRRQIGGILIYVPGRPRYVVASSVRIDERRNYAALHSPVPALAPSSAPRPLRTETYQSVSGPGQDTLLEVLEPAATVPAPSSKGAAAARSSTATRVPITSDHIPDGTRVTVLGVQNKWWPGRIIGRRLDKDKTVIHKIQYDNESRTYWHDFTHEQWKLLAPRLNDNIEFRDATILSTRPKIPTPTTTT